MVSIFFYVFLSYHWRWILFTGNIAKATFYRLRGTCLSIEVLKRSLQPWIFGLRTIKLQITSTKKELFQHCNSPWLEIVENPNCLKQIYQGTGTFSPRTLNIYYCIHFILFMCYQCSGSMLLKVCNHLYHLLI